MPMMGAGVAFLSVLVHKPDHPLRCPTTSHLLTTA